MQNSLVIVQELKRKINEKQRTLAKFAENPRKLPKIFIFFALLFSKMEALVNIYILRELLFGWEGGDVSDSVLRALSKLDARKAFDRVSQHR